jgi:dGTPase
VSVLGDNGIERSEQQDLLQFEGNAQGFRTLCSLQNQPRPGGLQLTLAVLGTFSKYPRESNVDGTQAAGISGKKFGFMQAEAPLFQELANELGLVPKPGTAMAWHRHPLAFLVEAADDICYHVMDVEDGFKAGAITYEVLEALHKPWLSPTQVTQALTITDEQRRAEYFRAVTVNQMIGEMINVFESNYDGLMTGSFDAELSEHIPRRSEFDNFKSIAKANVYNARPVVEVETCGFEVIAGLLHAFVDAIETIAKNRTTGKVRARTVISLMPGGTAAVTGRPAYERIILATDFVSGMTDSYAVELYQRVRGIALP